MTVNEALALAQAQLTSSSSPRLDAEVMLASLLHTERSHLIGRPELVLGLVNELRYRWQLNKRQRGVPVAYLVNEQNFYGRSFYVTRATLIPRPDTETLVEAALSTLRADNSITTLADIGTGSGCIAVSIACSLPQLAVLATDNSRAALRVAEHNAVRYGVNNRLKFYRGHLLYPLIKRRLITPHTLLVANLPYLTPHEVSGELVYEPYGALVAGRDGLACYRALFAQVREIPGTARPRYLLLEIHPPLTSSIEQLLKYLFPESQAKVIHDMANRARVLAVQLAKNP